jgi:hypothetical protein
MNCDSGFVIVVLLLIVSMTGNFYCLLRWCVRKFEDAFNEAEKGERNGSR